MYLLSFLRVSETRYRYLHTTDIEIHMFDLNTIHMHVRSILYRILITSIRCLRRERETEIRCRDRKIMQMSLARALALASLHTTTTTAPATRRDVSNSKLSRGLARNTEYT